jgi:mRNA interferase MazF
MRPIHMANLDKRRPVLILTREIVRPHLNNVTVAPITSTIRGLSTEVGVGYVNGLDHDSVVSLDNITTIPKDNLAQRIGFLFPAQEEELASAIRAAFDLE